MTNCANIVYLNNRVENLGVKGELYERKNLLEEKSQVPLG